MFYQVNVWNNLGGLGVKGCRDRVSVAAVCSLNSDTNQTSVFPSSACQINDAQIHTLTSQNQLNKSFMNLHFYIYCLFILLLFVFKL